MGFSSRLFTENADRRSSMESSDSNKNSGGKIQIPERSFSKISTIPEEGNEDPDDALYDISNTDPNNMGLEECCTPPPPTDEFQNLLARAVQVPNRIRRLRSRRDQTKQKQPKNVWFTGKLASYWGRKKSNTGYSI